MEDAAQKKNKPQSSDNANYKTTCLNSLNALSGVGLLSVPYALSEGGWVCMVLLAAVATAFCYTGLLLTRCMATDSSVRTYADIGERAFGQRGRLLVLIFMFVELYLVAVSFLILEGDNLEKLFPNASVSLGSVALSGRWLFVVLVALAIAPTTWLHNLGVFAYISTSGVFASIIIILTVLWTAAIDDVGFSGKGTPLRLTGLPTALGLFMFCYGGHPVFPALYTSMRDKSQFPKIIVMCFAFCTLTYRSMAILGYLMYGHDVQSQVTLNLPAARISSQVEIYTTLLNPFSKYTLMIMPIATAIEEKIQASTTAAVVVRTLLVVSTVVVAVAVPFFAYVTALVGSLLCVGACVVLPCVCYIRIFHPPRGPIMIASVIVIGCLVSVVGTYSSVMHIIHQI